MSTSWGFYYLSFSYFLFHRPSFFFSHCLWMCSGNEEHSRGLRMFLRRSNLMKAMSLSEGGRKSLEWIEVKLNCNNHRFTKQKKSINFISFSKWYKLFWIYITNPAIVIFIFQIKDSFGIGSSSFAWHGYYEFIAKYSEMAVKWSDDRGNFSSSSSGSKTNSFFPLSPILWGLLKRMANWRR